MGFKVKDFPYENQWVATSPRCLPWLRRWPTGNDFDFIMVDVCLSLNQRNQKTIETRDIALTRAGKLRDCLIFNRRMSRRP